MHSCLETTRHIPPISELQIKRGRRLQELEHFSATTQQLEKDPSEHKIGGQQSRCIIQHDGDVRTPVAV
jgi:hypothetical protein